jgi:hypothetical protein
MGWADGSFVIWRRLPKFCLDAKILHTGVSSRISVHGVAAAGLGNLIAIFRDASASRVAGGEET